MLAPSVVRLPWRLSFFRQRWSPSQVSFPRPQSFHCTPLVLGKHTSRGKRSGGVKVFNKPKKAIFPLHEVWLGVNVKELAKITNLRIDDIFEFVLRCPDTDHIHDELTPINDQAVLKFLAEQLRVRFKLVQNPRKIKVDSEEKNLDIEVIPSDPKDLVPRPPVVAIMGHVDHGKTTLLDYLRRSKIVAGEFGGITQHIGAFSVSLKEQENENQITFIDTPGHAAFKAMRLRGAKSTDIVILVVDVSEGVLEQTRESIRMIKESGAQMIVALNKIDRPKANVESTKEQLRDAGVQLEDFGGDIQSVPISALHGTNVSDLIEAILIQAELLQLTGDPTGLVEGIVIEANVREGLGKCATVLVQRGTLRKGSVLVSGTSAAKVRLLIDDQGGQITQVGPSEAANVVGWKSVPSAGDGVNEVSTDKRANEVIRWREKQIAKEKETKIVTEIAEKQKKHEEAYRQHRELKKSIGFYRKLRYGTAGYERPKESEEYSGPPQIPFIIKADVDGSLEAIMDCLESYQEGQVVLDVLDVGVGEVTQSDVLLAEQFGGTIYAFNCKVAAETKKMATEKGVAIDEINIIYKLIDHLKQLINDNMPEIDEEEITGKAVVSQEFLINVKSKKYPTAGVKVQSGKICSKDTVKIVRNDKVIYKGALVALKHMKDDAQEMEKGTECALMVDDRSIRYEKDDIIYPYVMKKVKNQTSWNPGF